MSKAFPDVRIVQGALLHPDSGKFQGTYAEEADFLLSMFENDSLALPGQLPERFTESTCFTQGVQAVRMLLRGCTTEAPHSSQKESYSLARRSEILHNLQLHYGQASYMNYCILEGLANDVSTGYRFNPAEEAFALEGLCDQTVQIALSEMPETTRFAAISANAALTSLGFCYRARHRTTEEVQADPQDEGLEIPQVKDNLNLLLDNALRIERPDLRVMAAQRILKAWKEIKSNIHNQAAFNDPEFAEKMGNLILNPDNGLDAAEMLMDNTFRSISLMYRGQPLIHFRNIVTIIENLKAQHSDKAVAMLTRLTEMVNTKLVNETPAGFYGTRGLFYSFTTEDAGISIIFSDAGIRIPKELQQKIAAETKKKKAEAG